TPLTAGPCRPTLQWAEPGSSANQEIVRHKYLETRFLSGIHPTKKRTGTSSAIRNMPLAGLPWRPPRRRSADDPGLSKKVVPKRKQRKDERVPIQSATVPAVHRSRRGGHRGYRVLASACRVAQRRAGPPGGGGRLRRGGRRRQRLGRERLTAAPPCSS